jgi:hypothetical protein
MTSIISKTAKKQQAITSENKFSYLRFLLFFILIVEFIKNIILDKIQHDEGFNITASSLNIALIICPLLYLLLNKYYITQKGKTKLKALSKYLVICYALACVVVFIVRFTCFEEHVADGYEWISHGMALSWILLLSQEIFISKWYMQAMIPTVFVLCLIILSAIHSKGSIGYILIRLTTQWVYLVLYYILREKYTPGERPAQNKKTNYFDQTKILDLIPENIFFFNQEGEVMYSNKMANRFITSLNFQNADDLFLDIKDITKRISFLEDEPENRNISKVFLNFLILIDLEIS